MYSVGIGIGMGAEWPADPPYITLVGEREVSPVRAASLYNRAHSAHNNIQ